jgi:hypothetical protein
MRDGDASDSASGYKGTTDQGTHRISPKTSSCSQGLNKDVIGKIVLLTLCLIWLGSIVFGMKVLWAYKSTPGSSGSVHPVQWPSSSSIQRESGHMTLLMFGHPNCPCTRASVNELGRLAARFNNQLQIYIIFTIDGQAAENLEQSQLWKNGSSIPGAKVLRDVDGSEAQRFSVETSGHTLLYNKQGKLMFSGGITQVRGHEGNSFGRQRIISLITTGKADRNDSPVFGCSLLSTHAQAQEDIREENKHGSH